MDRIRFVGTAGGRMATITQLRKTAGIFLELEGARIYLDPGPGALVHARAEKLPLEKLDAVLLSHEHIDHTNDAQVLVEAMTKGAREKRGILAAPKSALSEITEYHKSAPEKVISLKPGVSFVVGSLKIEATKTTHTDKDGIGFIFHAKKRISYVSDTIYSKAIAQQHKGADILILNCLYLVNEDKGKDVRFAKHMDLADAVKFINDIKPGLCILQHFGMGMILKNPWEKAKEVEEKTGIKTIAAKDGQVFDVGDNIKKDAKGLEKFVS